MAWPPPKTAPKKKAKGKGKPPVKNGPPTLADKLLAAGPAAMPEKC